MASEKEESLGAKVGRKAWLTTRFLWQKFWNNLVFTSRRDAGHEDSTLFALEPQEVKKRMDEFQTSFAIGSKDITCLDSFAKYTTKRSDAIEAVIDKCGKQGRASLDDATKKKMRELASPSESKEVMENFEWLSKNMLTAETNKEFKSLSLNNALEKLKSEAKTALNKQIAADATSMNTLNGTVSEEVKRELLKALSTSHDAASAELDKAMADNIKQLFKKAQIESSRINDTHLLRELIKEDKGNEKVLAECKKSIPGCQVSAAGGIIEPFTYKDFKLNDLTSQPTLTGQTINTGDGEVVNGFGISMKNSFTIQLPGRNPGFSLDKDFAGGWLSWIGGDRSYYTDENDNILSDLTQLAVRVRESGFNVITTNITSEGDEKHDRMLAKKAYQAALDAGFDHNNINITIGGVKQDILNTGEKKGLFSSTHALQAAAKVKTKQKAQDLQALIKETEYKWRDAATGAAVAAEPLASLAHVSTSRATDGSSSLAAVNGEVGVGVVRP